VPDQKSRHGAASPALRPARQTAAFRTPRIQAGVVRDNRFVRLGAGPEAVRPGIAAGGWKDALKAP